MSLDLIRSLARDGEVFTIDEAVAKTSIRKEVLRVLLSRLETRGLIERIEKGKYLIIPLDSSHGGYSLHEFVVGSLLVRPCAISYWSALHWYGMTEQIPSTVFVQTPSRKKKQLLEIFGVEYRIVKIKEEKFFGLRHEWIEETSVPITDREKTIIDCLDKPHYAGGIQEVSKSLLTKELEMERLVTYAQSIGNSMVIRRLGYLCDLFHIPINLEIPNIRKYEMLDPTMPKTGNLNTKWRLIINVDEIPGVESI